jgi:outer membrane protein assembly factor BamB
MQRRIVVDSPKGKGLPMTRPRQAPRRGLPFVSLAMAVMVFASPVGSADLRALRGPADWPQYGFDEGNTQHNPFESILDPSNVGQVQGLWRAKGGSHGPPAVVGDVVYACAWSPYHVIALDGSTGARLWASQREIYCASPAVSSGIVFASNGRWLFALDAATGAELWAVSIGVPLGWGPPKVAGDTVYIAGTNGAEEGVVYAIDAGGGGIRWTASVGAVGSAVAVGDGRVYVQDQEERLIALDALSGTRLWWVRLGSSLSGLAPVFANGVVFAAAIRAAALFALDAATGATLWSIRTFGCFAGNPTLGDGVVFLPHECRSASLIGAYDAATGAEIWLTEVPGARATPSPIVTANGVGYVGTSSSETDSTYVTMLDAGTGQVLAQVRLGEEALPPHTPIVVNGRIYVDSTGFYWLYAMGLR